MANDVTRVPTSPPYGGNAFRLENITNVDGTTVNSIVLTGFDISDPPFKPNGMLINVITSTDNTGTLQASYASYDRDSLILDPTNAEQVKVDIYVKGGTGTICDLFVW